MTDDNRVRCKWAVGDESLRRYHDEEWGIAPSSDAGWLEMIVLETFQAGLSWRTVLRKRDGFRRAFRGFAIDGVAEFTSDDIDALLQDASIIRNRRKLEAAVENARIATGLIEQYGCLADAFTADSDPDTVVRRLSETFVRVGKMTAQSIAYATGIIPPPHEESCFMSGSGPGHHP